MSCTMSLKDFTRFFLINKLITELQKQIDNISSDTSDRVNELSDLIGVYRNELQDITGLSNIVDLTPTFVTGNVSEINELIIANLNNVIYVGPGDYEINGTIALWLVKSFYCFGNIIGPTDVAELTLLPNRDEAPAPYNSNANIRPLILFTGGVSNRCYIKRITIRHDYCGFYVRWASNANITIDEIAGDYTNTPDYDNTLYTQYKSVFNGGAKFSSKDKRYKPIIDAWYMNSGIMIDKACNSTFNIWGIINLNYGIHIIETRADTGYSGLGDMGYDIGIWGNTFNINSIVCKRAVDIDAEHAIRIVSGHSTLTSSFSYADNDVHGNTFNINCLDYSTAYQTNLVEICNPEFYDLSKDNRRIMFNVVGKDNNSGAYIADNSFNVNYMQGIYDVVLNAKNTSNIQVNGYLLPNDIYFNNGTSHSQRNYISSTYERGTSSGYESAVTIQISPILIFDNCYNIKINNLLMPFIRSNEVSVTNNCRNIEINQISDTNDKYHRILTTNYRTIETRIYDGDDIYVKQWNDGFTKQGL